MNVDYSEAIISPNGSIADPQHDADTQQNSGNDNGEHHRNKTSLIVNYLPQSLTQGDVQSLFSNIGELESCKLICDKLSVMGGTGGGPQVIGNSLGYAFVNYIRPEDAEKAIATMSGLRLQNKTIKVSYARPSSQNIKGANIYVSGLPKTLTQNDLEDMFNQHGQIITSRLLYEANPGERLPGISRGVGFVRFDQKQQAETAIAKLNGTTPEGCKDPITVKFANPPGSQNKVMPQFVSYPLHMQSGPIHNARSNAARFRYSPLGGPPDLMNAPMNMLETGSNSGWCIFVYNLAADTEESSLWPLFGPFGAVQSVKLMRNQQNNECKGFGFVTMSNYDDAITAIKHLNGSTLNGRVLQVSFKSGKNRMRM